MLSTPQLWGQVCLLPYWLVSSQQMRLLPHDKVLLGHSLSSFSTCGQKNTRWPEGNASEVLKSGSGPRDSQIHHHPVSSLSLGLLGVSLETHDHKTPERVYLWLVSLVNFIGRIVLCNPNASG